MNSKITQNAIIHIRNILPPSYPLEPPAAYIVDGFPFDHKFHEHVHDGGSICCDLTSNFKWFFSSEERSGWSTACSLKSLLMQLTTFFTEPDLPSHLMPSEKDVEIMMKNVQNFRCTGCTHTTANPYPPIMVSLDTAVETSSGVKTSSEVGRDTTSSERPKLLRLQHLLFSRFPFQDSL